VIPVGLTFEDKVALRSRVVIRAGRPIAAGDPLFDQLVATHADTANHLAVRSLTDEIRDRLAEVSPDFTDNLTAIEMRRAADAILRTDHGRPLTPVSLARREELASELNDLPEAERSNIGIAVAEYQLLMSEARITDDVVASAVGRGTRPLCCRDAPTPPTLVPRWRRPAREHG